MNNESKTIHPHSFILHNRNNGSTLRMCTVCGMTHEMLMVGQVDEKTGKEVADSAAPTWVPVDELDRKMNVLKPEYREACAGTSTSYEKEDRRNNNNGSSNSSSRTVTVRRG